MPVMETRPVSRELSEQEIRRKFNDLCAFYEKRVEYLCTAKECTQWPARRKRYPNGSRLQRHYLFRDDSAKQHSKRTGHSIAHIDDYL